MKKIKEIVLLYENCDGHTLTPDMFERLMIDGITRSYWINSFQYKNGEVNEFINCANFEITIIKDTAKSFMGERSIKQRLTNYKDITHIDLLFEDGTNEYITVPWEGEYEENLKQKVTFREKEIDIKIK